jgi:hypothetical protein
MAVLWTIVSFAFTFGVLGIVSYAFVRIFTAGRHAH